MKYWGLGVMSVAALAPSINLASAASTLSLQDLLLVADDRLQVTDVYADAMVSVSSTWTIQQLTVTFKWFLYVEIRR